MPCVRTTPSPFGVTFALLTTLLIALPAERGRADGVCADMNTLLEQAQSNFAGDVGSLPQLRLDGADSCATFFSPGESRGFHCVWEFSYRAAEAEKTFTYFDETLQRCFADRARVEHDQPVNHPDSYRLQQYQVGPVTVSVSLKDKSALQKTYVFLRVDGANRD